MKEKIIEAIKKYHSKYGLSKEAIDGVASLLSKTITKEEEIDASVQDPSVAAFLSAYQKDVDTLRTARTKTEKELEEYKKANPVKEPVKPAQPTQTQEPNPEIEELKKAVASLIAQNAEKDREIARQGILTEVGRIMTEKGCSNETVRKLAMGKVRITDEATIADAQTIAEGGISEYNSLYKSLYGEGVIPPTGGGGNSQEYKPGMFAEVVKRRNEATGFTKEQSK